MGILFQCVNVDVVGRWIVFFPSSSSSLSKSTSLCFSVGFRLFLCSVDIPMDILYLDERVLLLQLRFCVLELCRNGCDKRVFMTALEPRNFGTIETTQ
jgi:hypothetical protein